MHPAIPPLLRTPQLQVQAGPRLCLPREIPTGFSDLFDRMERPASSYDLLTDMEDARMSSQYCWTKAAPIFVMIKVAIHISEGSILSIRVPTSLE
jgi:hypothetical protein